MKKPSILIGVIFAFLFTILSISEAKSQENYFEIKSIYRGDIDTHGLDGGISIPCISHQTDTLVAKKINETIQQKFFNGLYSNKGQKLFEDFINDIYSVSLDYSIIHNTKDILSISFAKEGLVMSYSKLNFNPKNGELISIFDLFTSTGLDNISKKVKDYFKIRIYEYFVHQLEDKKLSEEEIRELNSYVGCNSYPIDFKDYEFGFDEKYIYLMTSDCLRYDNIGWSAAISLENINCSDMSDAGRLIFSKCAEIKVYK